jgi:AcrR family transcriptional regulator
MGSADRKSRKSSESRKEGRGKLDLESLLVRIVGLLARHSPDELSFSKVARWTGVPRSTLYYYFGNSREEMIRQAVQFSMKQFAQLQYFEPSDGKLTDWVELEKVALATSAGIVEQFPWAPLVHLRYRSEPGRIGRATREIEQAYTERRGRLWKSVSGREADWRSVRLVAYVKIGVFLGLQADGEFWLKPANRKSLETLIDRVSRMSYDIMREPWVP